MNPFSRNGAFEGAGRRIDHSPRQDRPATPPPRLPSRGVALTFGKEMKRNMDLIRLLLLRSEGDQDAAAECTKFTVEELGYHVQLLIDAGLVEGMVARDSNGAIIGAVVSRLTWSGHEFVQTMRDNTLWKKAKEHFLKPGVSWSFDLLKEWAKHELKQKLGLTE